MVDPPVRFECLVPKQVSVISGAFRAKMTLTAVWEPRRLNPASSWVHIPFHSFHCGCWFNVLQIRYVDMCIHLLCSIIWVCMSCWMGENCTCLDDLVRLALMIDWALLPMELHRRPYRTCSTPYCTIIPRNAPVEPNKTPPSVIGGYLDSWHLLRFLYTTVKNWMWELSIQYGLHPELLQ